MENRTEEVVDAQARADAVMSPLVKTTATFDVGSQPVRVGLIENTVLFEQGGGLNGIIIKPGHGVVDLSEVPESMEEFAAQVVQAEDVVLGTSAAFYNYRLFVRDSRVAAGEPQHKYSSDWHVDEYFGPIKKVIENYGILPNSHSYGVANIEPTQFKLPDERVFTPEPFEIVSWDAANLHRGPLLNRDARRVFALLIAAPPTGVLWLNGEPFITTTDPDYAAFVHEHFGVEINVLDRKKNKTSFVEYDVTPDASREELAASYCKNIKNLDTLV